MHISDLLSRVAGFQRGFRKDGVQIEVGMLQDIANRFEFLLGGEALFFQC